MWRECLRAQRVSAGDIRETERDLGVTLPVELVRFMKVHQGMALDTPVTDATGRPLRFGHFYSFTDNEAGDSTLRERCLMYRRRGYPDSLVPFASAVDNQAHLALDYVGSPSRPAVVFVYPDGDAEATGYWSTSPVAADVASLLALLDPTYGARA